MFKKKDNTLVRYNGSVDSHHIYSLLLPYIVSLGFLVGKLPAFLVNLLLRVDG